MQSNGLIVFRVFAGVEQRERNGQPIEQNKKENNNSGFNENHNLYSIFLASKRANEKQTEDNRTSNEDKHHQEVKSDKNPKKGDTEESNIRENKVSQTIWTVSTAANNNVNTKIDEQFVI